MLNLQQHASEQVTRSCIEWVVSTVMQWYNKQCATRSKYVTQCVMLCRRELQRVAQANTAGQGRLSALIAQAPQSPRRTAVPASAQLGQLLSRAVERFQHPWPARTVLQVSAKQR